MGKKQDLPAMPFYVGDWLKAPEVRAMPPDYRGLWFDCLCFMWESTERGYLVKPNGIPYTREEVVRMVGLDNLNSGFWLTYIIDNEVCSIRETDGAIYSRKMVRDEEIRIKRKNAGSKGGNPNLVNYMDNQKVNQIPENENENENKEVSNKEERKRSLRWPDLKDVIKYFEGKMYPKEEAEEFWNHYEALGWVNGSGIPITNWRVKAENWHKRNLQEKLEGKNGHKSTKSGSSFNDRLNYKPNPDSYAERLAELEKQGFDKRA